MMQPQKIRPLTRIQVKNGPAIELSPELEAFCRKYNYWPTRSEIKIRKPTEQDRELVQQLRAKIKDLRVIYEA